MTDDTCTANRDRLAAIAARHNLELNPDEERVAKVIGLMAANDDAVGEWICPCKQQHKPPEAGKDTTCPCPEWLDEIAENEQCLCRLFVKPGDR